MNIKLGMVITWINSIVKIVAIATCLEKTSYSASIMQRVYSLSPHSKAPQVYMCYVQ